MQKYGLIGYPLKHSFSIGFFNEKFKSEGIDAEYVNFEIPEINDFMEVIEENPNLCGLNVTIPYKEQVIPFLDELDKDTAKIGAVNVIKIIRTPKRKIKLVGYNSDIIGFSQSIQPLLCGKKPIRTTIENAPTLRPLRRKAGRFFASHAHSPSTLLICAIRSRTLLE